MRLDRGAAAAVGRELQINVLDDGYIAFSGFSWYISNVLRARSLRLAAGVVFRSAAGFRGERIPRPGESGLVVVNGDSAAVSRIQMRHQMRCRRDVTGEQVGAAAGRF